MKKANYLRSDIKRALIPGRFIAGCLGVTFTMFLSIYKMTNINSVYRTYSDAIYFIPFILSMTFCAIPFAGSINEDLEYKYINMLLLKGSKKKYTVSKILTIYISAISVMAVGILCFVILIRIRVPYIVEGDIVSQDILMRIMGNSKFYLLYFFIHAIYMGLLAGNLSMLAAFTSLYWTNKLLMLSVPFMGYYFMVYYSGELFSGYPQMNVSFMFNPVYNVWNNSTMSLVIPFLTSILFAVILGVCLYKKLRGEFNG